MTRRRLQGKVAIITGGASGIGAAAVELFAQEGAHVFAIDCDIMTLKIFEEGINIDNVTFVHADVSQEAEVKAAIHYVMQKAGRVDILYNNAGTGLRGLLHETSLRDWDRIQNVNLRSVFLMCKYNLPEMMTNRSGVILNTSSGIGLVGSRSHHAYSASKAGVILITRSIAVAYAKHNIRANCICPGPIDTPMLDNWVSPNESEGARQQIAESIPLGRLGRPEEIASAALFLASDESSFITGAVLPVDGGILA